MPETDDSNLADRLTGYRHALAAAGIAVSPDLQLAGAFTQQGGADATRRIVGFDDSPIAATTDPPLISVRQPIEEMGREWVRLLLERMADPGSVPRKVMLATQLIRRRSSEGCRRSRARAASNDAMDRTPP